MELTIGFSPCPNDTFIFDALIHQRVDTEGLRFRPFLEDVETLNQRAFAGELDITKLSFHAFGYLTDTYTLLDAGSALGNNCGPLLIARRPLSLEEIEKGPIAIPGKYTTANFLLGLAYPNAQHKQEIVFSAIEDAVLSGAVPAGLIIHENRFTYQDKGLVKLMDCGEYWESTYRHPIPLGGIVVHKRLPLEIQQQVNRVLRRSVRYAFAHPEASLPYVSAHAQEMSPSVMRQHIELYVNDYSKELGPAGRAAVQTLFEVARSKKIIPDSTAPIFLDAIPQD